MILAVAISAIGSLAVAIVVTWLVMTNASRLGLVDIPNVRSSHDSATPRGGGIGIVAAVIAGFLLLGAFGFGPSRKMDVLLLGAGAIAALGVIDDRRRLAPAFRLVLQLLVACGVVVALGSIARLPLPPPFDASIGWLAAPLTVIWLVGLTNFYNFMDGIDGLAGGQAIASCIGVAVAAWAFSAVAFAVILAASALGFLVFNRPPARIFLGDSGSTSLGFAIASLPLLAPSGQRPIALFAVAVGLSIFILDPVETLVRIARAGHRIGTAHRSHSYQLLAWNRRRQPLTAGVLVGAGLVLALAGGIAYRFPSVAWPVFLLGLGAYGIERYLALRPGLQPTIR